MHGRYRFDVAVLCAGQVVFGFKVYYRHLVPDQKAADLIYFSQTRMWMALCMGATMAVIMLGYMLGIYRNRRVNLSIFMGSPVVFAGSLWLLRSQATVGDVAYMKEGHAPAPCDGHPDQ